MFNAILYPPFRRYTMMWMTSKAKSGNLPWQSSKPNTWWFTPGLESARYAVHHRVIQSCLSLYSVSWPACSCSAFSFVLGSFYPRLQGPKWGVDTTAEGTDSQVRFWITRLKFYTVFHRHGGNPSFFSLVTVRLTWVKLSPRSHTCASRCCIRKILYVCPNRVN